MALERPKWKVSIRMVGRPRSSNIVNHDSPSMLRELPVLPGKTTVSAKKVGRFPLEKEKKRQVLPNCFAVEPAG